MIAQLRRELETANTRAADLGAVYVSACHLNTRLNAENLALTTEVRRLATTWGAITKGRTRLGRLVYQLRTGADYGVWAVYGHA